jgi:hypothetical protein
MPKPNIPRVWKIAIALNVPASLLGAAIAAFAIKQGSEAYVLLFATPFVPLFWYLIGRWLDYEFRFLPPPRKSAIRIVFACLGILIALFGVFSVVVSFPHGHISTPLITTTLWSFLLLLMCVTALLRQPEPAKK